MRHPRAAMLSISAAAAVYLVSASFVVQGQGGPSEAPAGFNDRTNGMISQAAFDAAKAAFEEREVIADGLGPVYNAQACAECHQNPVTGAISQVAELRAGHLNASGNFVDAPGGSLINDRAVDASIQERVPGAENIRSFRMSTNTLGAGFVEAINSNTLLAIANAQPEQSEGRIGGQAITVPVLEANGAVRVGRFGWKNQHASLVSFSADAYLNEMGITSALQPVENTSLGRPVVAFDPPALREVGGFVEDEEDDVAVFAAFMRASRVPPRDNALAATADAVAGSQLFDAIGCGTCHTRSIVTSPAGSIVNGGQFRVPAALGNKVIHPFSDFALHDIGTGDGIVQNGGQSTRNKVRTQPLWGVRTHTRHMHDGASLTFTDAILRHAGEARDVINSFRLLSASQRNQIVVFLQSL
jgi:CxxC motif-containing protein (DUF1111 family)